MRKKILVVTYGGGHVNIMVPIIKELNIQKDVDVVVIGLSIAGSVLLKNNIPFLTFADFKNIIWDNTAQKEGERLATEYYTSGKDLTFEDTILYFGCLMRDMLIQYSREEIQALINEKGKKAFLPQYTMSKIIDQIKPDFILTGDCPRSERAATIVGKEKHIPTMNIHDYLAFESRHKLEADTIAVMCDITRDNLIKQGHDSDKIVITGQPAFDSILNQSKVFKITEILNKYKLPQQKYIVLGTQPDPSSKDMLNLVIEVMKQYPEYGLLVKPHPGEDICIHKEIISNHLGSNIFLLPEADIRELIFISNTLITIFSTVGFESVLFGKPLIQLNLTGKPNPIPLFKYGVSLCAENKADLEESLKKALLDHNYLSIFQRNRMLHFNYLLEAQGTKNIVKLIYSKMGISKDQIAEDKNA